MTEILFLKIYSVCARMRGWVYAHLCIPLHMWKLEEGVGSPGAGVIGTCKKPGFFCGCSELECSQLYSKCPPSPNGTSISWAAAIGKAVVQAVWASLVSSSLTCVSWLVPHPLLDANILCITPSPKTPQAINVVSFTGLENLTGQAHNLAWPYPLCLLLLYPVCSYHDCFYFEFF